MRSALSIYNHLRPPTPCKKGSRKKVRLAVVGSRDFQDYDLLTKTLDSLQGKWEITCIVSGGAPGADRLAEEYAKERGLPKNILIPDWNGKGRGAGLLRNKDIVAASDCMVAFWDGYSRGTANAIRHAKEAGKPCMIVPFSLSKKPSHAKVD